MDDRTWIREGTLTMQLAIPLDLGINNRHIYIVHQRDRLFSCQLCGAYAPKFPPSGEGMR